MKPLQGPYISIVSKNTIGCGKKLSIVIIIVKKSYKMQKLNITKVCIYNKTFTYGSYQKYFSLKMKHKSFFVFVQLKYSMIFIIIERLARIAICWNM